MKNPFIGEGIKSDDKPSDNVEYIIDRFLAKGVITTYFAPAKHGKSVVAQALSKYICENTDMYVQYFDFDNGLISLVERGWFEVVDKLDNIDYISKDKTQTDGHEAIDNLLDYAKKTPDKVFENFVLIFDSATNFMYLDTEEHSKKLLKALMTFRSKGATVILLHHMNKSGRNYQGSQVFITASDNIYEHKQVEENEYKSVFTHKKYNTRFSNMIDIAFEVQKKSFDMKILNYNEAIIQPKDQAFIDSIVKVLKANPDGIGQSNLLAEIGKEKADRTALMKLEEHKDRFWEIKNGKGKLKLYFSI